MEINNIQPLHAVYYIDLNPSQTAEMVTKLIVEKGRPVICCTYVTL
jgi:hypothetical protein